MGIFTLGKPDRSKSGRQSRTADEQGQASLADCNGRTLVPEEMFTRALSLERKRSQRSRQRFVLMLVDAGTMLQGDNREMILEAITKAVVTSTRETDLWGWYKRDAIVGVICTEIGDAGLDSILSALQARITDALRADLSLDDMNVIHISFHVFPDELRHRKWWSPCRHKAVSRPQAADNVAKVSLVIKRSIDIVGSSCALLVLSPRSS